MDQQQQENTSLFQLNLDAQNSYTLRSAASWAKVLGICGLILGFLVMIAAIVVLSKLNELDRYGEYSGYRTRGLSMATLGGIGVAFYFVVAIIFIVSSIFALNASNKIGRGLKTNDQASLNAGFAGVRNYFAIWAIVMIIVLLFLLIGMVN